MNNWKKKLLENKDNGEVPLFKLLREQKPEKVENPKVEWATKEPTITIDEWYLIGVNIDNQEIWFNRKTKKIFEGNLN